MNASQLNKLTYTELKEIFKETELDIKIPKKKEELIEIILKWIKEYKREKKKKEKEKAKEKDPVETKTKKDKYEIIKQLGENGMQGITYLVKDRKGNEYAMKTFKKSKSSDRIKKEAMLQDMASEYGIAPKIVDVDLEKKYIVMEKMDKHLTDVISKQNGDITESQQKQLIRIFKGLDKAKVFHNDANILNYMFRKQKLFIIDFGISQEIDEKLIKKLGTSTPNIERMTLGFIITLKKQNCKSSSYSHLIKFIDPEEVKNLKL